MRTKNRDSFLPPYTDILGEPTTWKWYQWDKPKVFGGKYIRLCVWKWCGVWFPTWMIYFGSIGAGFGYDIFHNGSGFIIRFKYFHFEICTDGQFTWWDKCKWVKIRILNFSFGV